MRLRFARRWRRSVFLSTADLQRLTGKKRFTAQAKALEGLGIRYQLSGKGEPLVRIDQLDGTPKVARNQGPRWDRLNEASAPAPRR